MIVLIRGSGNHSNRLIQSVHFEAFCMENGYAFKNLDFADMAPLYKGCSAGCSFFERIVFVFFKAVRKIQNKTKIKFIKLYDYDILTAEQAPCDSSFVCGWNFRCNALVNRHLSYFQKKYELKEEYYNSNSLAIELSRKKNDIIYIGFHVRRGDYKTWLGGRYYFEREQYLQVAKKIESLLKKEFTGKSVRFVVFSNEDVASWFTDFKNVVISKNEWYVDQYLMSKMDYLAGPLSTFTMWASWIGRVPCLHIENPDTDLTLSSFEIKGSVS